MDWDKTIIQQRERVGKMILCLDGGGTRGLVEIAMLKQIKQQTNREIHQLFDMIGGTSTGGILAYLIGVKKLSLEKCEELYLSLARTIFASRWLDKMKTQVDSGGLAAHDTPLLESFAKLHLGEENLKYFEQSSPLTFAVSVKDTSQVRPFLFRTWNSNQKGYDGTNNCVLSDAALATSAAPTYFLPRKISGLGTFVDGGVGFNNPTEIGLEEATNIWDANDIKCIVSLGTGERKVDSMTTNILKFGASLVDIITSSSQVHERMKMSLPKNYKHIQYYRLNPPELGEYDLGEYRDSELQKMIKKTELYVQNNSEFNSLIELLKANEKFVEVL